MGVSVQVAFDWLYGHCYFDVGRVVYSDHFQVIWEYRSVE